ncbi:Isochorismatase-like protein [Cadophora sp. MPI-SDFR-AT-0126]|nr:Isochorismatase-like protein [Leotiomycetes sp. MPI-SDFR-AT-0126]
MSPNTATSCVAKPITSTSALIIIDMQNEFISPSGNFPISPLIRPTLLTNLKSLIPRFRAKNGHIIWIQAIYSNRTSEPAIMAAQVKGTDVIGSNAWLVAATHVYHIPCCEAGTWGADIYPETLELARPDDGVVVKQGYSAFWGGNRGLEAVLEERGVMDAYFCGVASGTCVLATICDTVARKRVEVHAVTDCMGWRRENTHVEALRRFEELGIDIVSSKQL